MGGLRGLAGFGKSSGQRRKVGGLGYLPNDGRRGGDRRQHMPTWRGELKREPPEGRAVHLGLPDIGQV